MIVVFTDFGAGGPYAGQLEAVLRTEALGIDVVRLMEDAPRGDPRLSAYVLAAISRRFSEGTVFLCVVDPGVGGRRLPIILRADGLWFVGPDNGLLNSVAVHARICDWWIIEWRPEKMSPTFHGRDLFAPVAARLACGDVPDENRPYAGPDLSSWPMDIATIIYIDHYGNAMTGWRYSRALDGKILLCNGHHRIKQSHTFCDVNPGEAFWYCNSSGLVEIAVNLGRADEELGLSLGSGFRFER